MELECYQAIKIALQQARGKLFQFEILPSYLSGETGLVCLENNLLSLPESTLFKSYRIVRQYSRYIRLSPVELGLQSEDVVEDLLCSTLLMAIVQPEHMTAINCRKRIILCTERNFLSPRDELSIFTGILSSPLFRHTKSPNLWAHRKWIIQKFRQSLQINVWDEMKLIMDAGQVHPKNYYAWNYGRWIFAQYTEFTDSKPVDWTISDLKFAILEWCVKHPSDVSGWSFLRYLICTTVDEPEATKENETVMEKITSFFYDIAPDREAILCFIIGVLSAPDVVDTEFKMQVYRNLKIFLSKQQGTTYLQRNMNLDKQFERLKVFEIDMNS